MEPILPEPTAPNSMPQTQEFNTGVPVSAPQSMETAPNTAPEQPKEGIPQSAPVQTTTMPAQPVTNDAPLAPVPVQTTDGIPADDPLIADDVDVIEKEWVDKAKKIVNATKEDPYQQEKEVSKLQADYLMKRYNKQLKLPE